MDTETLIFLIAFAGFIFMWSGFYFYPEDFKTLTTLMSIGFVLCLTGVFGELKAIISKKASSELVFGTFMIFGIALFCIFCYFEMYGLLSLKLGTLLSGIGFWSGISLGALLALITENNK